MLQRGPGDQTYRPEIQKQTLLFANFATCIPVVTHTGKFKKTTILLLSLIGVGGMAALPMGGHQTCTV